MTVIDVSTVPTLSHLGTVSGFKGTIDMTSSNLESGKSGKCTHSAYRTYLKFDRAWSTRGIYMPLILNTSRIHFSSA
jgi:hypothetical protein